MRNSVILAVTAAALASSSLVPSHASAASRGFAHAAQASRSVRAVSTGGVRTAGVGVSRSFGAQRPVSSGRVASGSSFTQRRFGSANTATGHPLSFGNRFSMANRTPGHMSTPTNTPQFNKLAANGSQFNANHSATCDHHCQVEQKQQQQQSNPKHCANSGPGNVVQIGNDCFSGATSIKPAVNGGCVNVQGTTNFNVGNFCIAGGTMTAAVSTGSGTGSGNGNKTPTQFTPPSLPPTNKNETAGGGNQLHPGTGGRPFPGQFPVAFGIGHGPFVGGPFASGPVAVGGSVGPGARASRAVAPVAVTPVASTGGGLPPVTAPSAPPPPAPSCLNKTYLQAGLVMFRDVCSQEWAMNSSSITSPAPTNSACLSKENPQNGVVLFKDNCTSEWAMNPQQQADSQAQN
jgi:hypothetical protein